MSKKRKKRSSKSGFPPGSLVHIGEEITDKIKIFVTRFNETEFDETEAKSLDVCKHEEDGKITWINIVGVHESETIKKIGERFKIHPLTLEDIMNTDNRAKMDDHGEYVFVILKHVSNGKGDSIELDFHQVSLILGANLVISFQETESNIFEPVRERLRAGLAKFSEMGAAYLFYTLMDLIVDNYFLVLEKLDDTITLVEDTSVAQHDSETLQYLHSIRREVIAVRRAVWPLREVISGIQKREPPLMARTNAMYWMDLYDHIIQVMDTTETYREILSNIFDIYLSSVNNKMNEVMKMLTIIATVFMPLTFLAGLYGMNFKYMPELEWRLGYPAVLIVMIAAVGLMYAFFKKKEWI